MKNERYCIYVTMYTLINNVVVRGYYTSDFEAGTCKNILVAPDIRNAKLYESRGDCRVILNRIMQMPNVIHAVMKVYRGA